MNRQPFQFWDLEYDEGEGMHDITVKKDELRAKVESNRNAHRAIFEEALDGFKEQALVLLQERVAEIRGGRIMHVAINLPVPEDHTTDYDRILAMLDMMIEDEVVLDEGTFSQYVMDDWHWKRQFLTTNSAYSAMARKSL